MDRAKTLTLGAPGFPAHTPLNPGVVNTTV